MELLDATVGTPNGGVATRCSGNTKSGERCAKPARRGYSTCASHRVEGEVSTQDDAPRGPGRPREHGVYSRTAAKTLRELRTEVADLEGDLDNTDEEMRTVKAILVFLFDQSEKLNAKADMLELAVEAVEETLESAKVIRDGLPGHGELTVPQARQLGQQLAKANGLLNCIAGYTDRLLEANYRSVSLSKIRAETRAKLAEQKSLEMFSGLLAQLARLTWEIAPDSEWLDQWEARITRDILEPNRLEHPAPRPENLKN